MYHSWGSAQTEGMIHQLHPALMKFAEALAHNWNLNVEQEMKSEELFWKNRVKEWVLWCWNTQPTIALFLVRFSSQKNIVCVLV